MRTKWNTSSTLGAAGVVTLAAAAGCQPLAAGWAVFSGGPTVPAQFKLTQGPLAILVDDPEQLGVAPEAIRTLYEQLARHFDEHNVNRHVIGLPQVQRLRQSDSDFDGMSIRQFGERLGAEQVLYLRVKYWALRENPGDAHFKGRWSVGLKVVSTQRKRDVRLWPQGPTRRTVTVETDPDLTDATGAETRIARELARKMADAVAKHFYAYKPLDE